MKHFLNKTKIGKIAILALSVLMIPLFAFAGNNCKTSEVKAENGRAYIAIDSSRGIGYLSSTLYDFMVLTNYHCQLEVNAERYDTIFLQDEWQGSESFLSDITTILIVDTVPIHNCQYLFKGLENLEEIVNIGNLDVSTCNNFSYMFDDCPKLRNVDFKDFDVSQSYDFSHMFEGSSFETLDLSSLNTSNGSDFERMFSDCGNLTSLNLSSFNTKNASNMCYMFCGCGSLEYLDISSFDLSNDPLTEDFFRGTEPKVIKAPKKVPEPNLNETNMVKFYLPQKTDVLFYYYDSDLNNHSHMLPANESITYYNEEDIKYTVERYSEFCLQIMEEIENLNSPDVDELRSCWNTLSALDFSEYYCEEDYEAITTILKECRADTVNDVVSEWLTIYDNLYTKYCHALSGYGGDFLNRLPNALDPDGLVHVGIDTTNNVGYISSFDTFEILNSDIKSKFNLSNENVQNSIFSLLGTTDYENITEVVIQDEVTIPKCENLFKGLTSVVSIEGMDNLITDQITSFISMFEDCESLETIDLSSLDTSSANETDKMFKNCSDLALINSLKFDSKSLHSISEMFYGCQSLSLLDLSNCDFTNVNNTFGCLDYSSFLYLKTPKAMPSNISYNIDFYFPQGSIDFAYYDLAFQTHTKIPKNNSSTLIISTIGKSVLDSICNAFNNDCEYYCVSDGSTSEQSLIKLLEDQYETFADNIVGTPNECLMEYFKQDNSTCTDTSLKSFSEKYDYIYGKYHTLLDEHGGDFAKRSELISFASNPSLININNEQNTLIIIVLVAISISGIGFILYVHRRKHVLAK